MLMGPKEHVFFWGSSRVHRKAKTAERTKLEKNPLEGGKGREKPSPQIEPRGRRCVKGKGPLLKGRYAREGMVDFG